jgi:hypothetical protein
MATPTSLQGQKHRGKKIYNNILLCVIGLPPLDLGIIVPRGSGSEVMARQSSGGFFFFFVTPLKPAGRQRHSPAHAAERPSSLRLDPNDGISSTGVKSLTTRGEESTQKWAGITTPITRRYAAIIKGVIGSRIGQVVG